MVRPLLPLLAGALVSWGCVLSNPPDFEQGGNHPPVIFRYDPSQDIIQIDTENERITKFRAWVRDEDRGDQVWYRWYIDYASDELACSCQDWGRAPRQGDGVYGIDWGLYNGFSALSAGKCHRLTVVVSDGPWLDGVEEDCGCPPVVDGALRVVRHWLIGAYSEAAPFDGIFLRDCYANQQDPLEEPPAEGEP